MKPISKRLSTVTLAQMRLALCLCLLMTACVGQETENYVFGFLRVHPERVSLPEAEANAIQKAHLEHLGKMSRDGDLVGAGPLIESPDLRGIVIFRGITADRARELASQDPAVINKRLRVHVEDWRSVKGIGDGIASKLKDPNFKIKMTRYGFVVSWWTPEAPKNWNSAEAKSKRKEHLEWFNANASKLAASGPFADSREFASVAVFRSTDLEEIRKLAAEEPFVKAGWARPEVLIWLVAEGVMPESSDHR